MATTRHKLLAVGGAEDKEGDCLILKEFVRLAHGDKANIAVMCVATDYPDEVGAEYRKVFKRLGVNEALVCDVRSREHTRSKKIIEGLEKATGIFFTGGDQLHITSLLGGTEIYRALRTKYEAGTIIAGTSAGAAMMSSCMVMSGEGKESPRFGIVEMAPGMDFIHDAIIDTHFAQRGRYGRLVTAVAHYPLLLGIGLDEDTGILVRGDEFKVIGGGAVTVIDAGMTTYTNLHELESGENLELHDVLIHILPAGARFSFSQRRPVTKSQSLKS
jgi:cyanophycinase